MNVYLAQFNIEYGNENVKNAMYLPYSAGCVWAYANQFDEIKNTYKLKEFLIAKTDPRQLVDSLDEPAVFGFSAYIWNCNYSLEIARLVKDKFPKCVIVFGGPQVPASKQEWLVDHDYVDYAIYKEGEIVFYNLLRRIAGMDHSTRGMGFLENGSLNKQEQPERISDLSKVPSPYVAGYFDALLEKYKGTNIILNAILETNRGCPFKCTFCDWGGVTESKVKKFEMCRIHEEILWMAKNQIEWVALADANFGAFKDRDMEIAQFLIKTKAEFGFPKMTHISWHKNQKDHLVDIAKMLMDAGMNKEFTASLQSTSPIVLEAIKRKNISPEIVSRMKTLSEDKGFKLHTELMAPLPGETYDSMKDGLEYCTDNNITFSLLPLQILPNSEMNNDIYRRTHGLVTQLNYMNESHPWVKEIEEVVISTNSMSKQEFNDIMLIGFLIQSFHTTGFTDLIAKYYKKTEHIEFTDFYRKFLVHFASDINTCVHRHIRPIANHVEDKTTNMTYAGIWNVPMYNDLGKTNREIFFGQVKEFCRKHLPENPNLDDLVSLQYNWQNHSDNAVETEIKCRSNLFDYIKNDTKFDLYDYTYQMSSTGINRRFISLGHFLNFTKATGAWQNTINLKN
jgi:radical SAM superfamily enzyme YgiQ (UPF0313 family)